jgi:hypothetical protein
VEFVNAIRKLTSGWRVISFAAALLIFLLTSAPLRAQSSSIPERLSSDTISYMHWRGKAFATQAEKKNSILQFIEDSDFTALRQKLADDFRKNMEKQGGPANVPTLTEFISLLDNPMTGGMMVNPLPVKKDAAGTAATPVGFFFIYDATGKTELIDLLRSSPQLKDKEGATVMKYEFDGATVEARTSGTSVSYTARVANYYIFADQKLVIESLIPRFRGAAHLSSSVTQLPEYKLIRPYIGEDSSIEFFARMPDLDKLIPEDDKNKSLKNILHSIRLEKLHVAGGGISFAGEATRFHGAILGDTSPIGVLDLTGASTAAFVTQPVVSPGPFFSISKFRWAAAYELFRAGMAGSSNPQQATAVANYEKMAQGFLSMSISEALALFTGELASETSYADDGTSLRIYAVSIQKPNDVLRILRATVGTMIVAEDTAGDTTFLDLSFPSTDPGTGEKKRTFYYVAVTPQMIYAAPRKSMVRAAMERLTAGSGSASPREFSANPQLNQMRSLLPEKLSGLSAADMTNLPWAKVLAAYGQVVAATAKDPNDPNSAAISYWNLVKPEVFSRHLHTAISGWWKDSNGIYFDSYVQ